MPHQLPQREKTKEQVRLEQGVRKRACRVRPWEPFPTSLGSSRTLAQLRVTLGQGALSTCSSILGHEAEKKLSEAENPMCPWRHPRGCGALQQPAPDRCLREAAARSTSLVHLFPGLTSTLKKCKAKTYGDSRILGGTADFPGRRDCLGDKPDGDSCWPDLLRQPDDHMAPRSLERLAIARGNTGLKPDSHDHQRQGSQRASKAACLARSRDLVLPVGCSPACK